MKFEAPSGEKDLIGILLRDADAYLDVSERMGLEPRHFQSKELGAIFRAIGEVVRAGSSYGLSLVEQRCRAEPDAFGGITLSAYLPILMRRETTGIEAAELAQPIRDRWHRRAFYDVTSKLPALANDPDIAGEALFERGITDISNAFVSEKAVEVRAAASLSHDLLTRLETRSTDKAAVNGIYTGFHALDELIAPLIGGRVYIAAGATSMGKSALVQLIAWITARQGIPVYLYTNEMRASEAHERIVAQMAKVDSVRLTTGMLNAAELERVAEAANRLSQMPLFIDDKEGLKVDGLRLRVQRLVRQKGIRLVIIDHLQFLEAATKGLKEYERVSELTREVKRIAVGLNLPVILVSHVNRGDDQDVRTAKDIRLPRLRDLHGSSSIEKDADAVLFVHRPIYYLERSEPPAGAKHRIEWEEDTVAWKDKAILIKAKMRGGVGFGTRRVRYTAFCTRFEDIDANAGEERLL
ncbi:replicative DNA helicase [Acuticoccus sediminis]|uniref:replicative DNA helicase n=1 Tax=Acuticoccus sediminis TaxID=2184697 RepID=UPI001CFF17F2|nr:DnaB-like helicase C-terminal domain-containing protein [Acuticoccus sediminis]